MSGYPIRSRGIPVLATLTWTSALNKHDVFHKACLRRLWKSVQPTFLLRSHYKGCPHVSEGVEEPDTPVKNQDGRLLLPEHLQVAETVVGISQTQVEQDKAERR